MVSRALFPQTDTMNRLAFLTLAASMVSLPAFSQPAAPRAQVTTPAPTRAEVTATMKKATTFMVETVAHKGGYVWAYLPDLSRRWGEIEARSTQIWIQPPGTPTMGHLFLDAYHATKDEFYYQAAEQVAGALIWGQHPAGGWNYVVDFAGERSLRDYYETVGKNAWRLEEFQHYYGNATFDDGGTADASKFLLRMYVEKLDPKYKPALDRAIRFVLDSQYPIGTWPQRYPEVVGDTPAGQKPYASYHTFNDDVAGENIDFLLMCYQVLGDDRVVDPILRAMNSFIVMQQGQPQPGWGLQHGPDMKPAGARSYEPKALATHTSARNIEQLINFYRLTGETKFLARIPEALDWLEKLKLPAGVAPQGRTHATFIEIGTNEPLYVHREGSNVVSGRYFVDKNPANTLGHYSSFRAIDTARLRAEYEAARALSPAELAKTSPLAPGAGARPLPMYFAVTPPRGAVQAADVIKALNAEGYWPSKLGMNTHPFKADSTAVVAPGNFATTNVGDESDTSPFRDDTLIGISLDTYIRNMGVLITQLDKP